MARKRLSPLGPGATLIAEPGPTLRPPIADIAGASAAGAALDEVTETLRRARESGRMVLSLPLAVVDAGHLTRDRLAQDPEDMAVLIASIRGRGQQTPIEVQELAPGRYGLISGGRRLTALRRLLAETGDAAAYGEVLALLRRPEDAASAWLAMVEENEIRSGISFYERARVVARAVETGVYPDDRSALRGLFGSVSRAKRSKIGSFLVLVRALDGQLQHPEAISEKLGLRLVQVLEQDPGFADRLIAALIGAERPDAASELAVLTEAQTPARAPKPRIEVKGVVLERTGPGSLRLQGPAVDDALMQALADWLRAR